MQTRKQVHRCPVHLAIKDAAIDELSHRGYFNKERILVSLNYTAMGDAIHWAFLVEMIEEDLKYKLTPLTQTFFTAERNHVLHINPRRAIATGHGKRCYGYASLDFADGLLESKRIEWQTNMLCGKAEKVTEQVKKIRSISGKSLGSEVAVVKKLSDKTA